MVVRQWTFVIAIAFAIGVGIGAQLPTRTVAPPPSAPAHIKAYFTPGIPKSAAIFYLIHPILQVAKTIYEFYSFYRGLGPKECLVYSLQAETQSFTCLV